MKTSMLTSEAPLASRMADNLLFWLFLTAVVAFTFGWIACVVWQKSKLTMHEWRNEDGSTAYWVLNFGRNVIEVGTLRWVNYRKWRMRRAIEGRDAYAPHSGVAAQRWAGGSGAGHRAAKRARLHPLPGTPGGGPESTTEGNIR